jgi:hypothetical protein
VCVLQPAEASRGWWWQRSGAGRRKHDELGMWESRAVISLLVLGVFRVSVLGEQFPAINYN